jgi:hypothetical protein
MICDAHEVGVRASHELRPLGGRLVRKGLWLTQTGGYVSSGRRVS